MTVQEWIVKDDARELRFTGEKLADVSSQRLKGEPQKRRWIEIRLYCTVGGNYIVERVGVTTFRTNPKTGAPEKNIHFAQVCETPKSVVETLYSRDDDGAWFLSWVARKVLEQAGQVDDAIESAYRVEHVE